jgi:NADPH2:quinone reductase
VQAIRMYNYGTPEVLQLVDLPTPVPDEGQIVVRVAAIGINFQDIGVRRGDYANHPFYGVQLPSLIGREGAGVVESVGPGVANLQPGTRVGWIGPLGAYATHIVFPASLAIVLPESISFEQAAAIMLHGPEAHALTHDAYALKDGNTCLVQPASGEIGLLICQMAKLRGARVIGTISTEAQAQDALQAGAGAVILHTQKDIAREVKRLTNEQGVQVVYDNIGKDAFEANLDSLAPCGLLIIYGQDSGPIPPVDLDTLMNKGSLFITRFWALPYLNTQEEIQRRIQDVFNWIEQGKLQIKIDRILPLAEAAQAHSAIEQRQTNGKVLLIP